MKTQTEQIKSWFTYFLLPIIIVIGIGGFLYFKSPDLLAPVLTPLVALIAFLGQQHQLRLQKEDSSLNRFTGTFFQLIEIHNNNVQDLKYQDPADGTIYQGRHFLKKAYHDLMLFYDDAVERQGGKPFKESMEKLDQKYNDNLHLYFKNLFQVFGWIFDHRKQMTRMQIKLYVNIIRSQLSLNEMMILYMNTSYLKRNFFYKILYDFGFFEMYNTDGYGKGTEGIENKFMDDVKVYIHKRDDDIDTHPSIRSSLDQTYTREDLYNAIEKEEIYFHYQPIVDASSGKLLSVEALMRWDKGINPSLLMDQFEHYGLTSEIFTYALDYISQHIKKSKMNVAFSMNLSVHQLLLSDMLDEIDGIREKYNIPAERLQFEITETSVLYEREQVKKVLSELRDRGHYVGIDDFGSGYFSFYDFVDLPIDFVKLDKQFVKKVDEQNNRTEMAAPVVEMAKSQNMRVTVEGIETLEQFNDWKEMNIDAMQGFFFGRAIDYKQLKDVWKSKRNLFPIDER